MAVKLEVVPCPQCGAPLQHSVTLDVKCASCGYDSIAHREATVMETARLKRELALALYANLGTPPTLTQRIAVVLVNKWLWIFGLPFMYALVAWFGRIIERRIEAIYELVTHVRMYHVASPATMWLLDIGCAAAVMALILIWSLFGERVDARRDLQAALAAKPPETEGGKARCRHCNAPLDVPPGALGVRCDHCSADNLVQIPREWAERARAVATDLQIGITTAEQHRAEGRRRVRRAAYWRVPIALGVLALAVVPALRSHRRADFAELREAHMFGLMFHLPKGALDWEARPIATCPQTSSIAAEASRWCGDAEATDPTCELVAAFALERGETLKLAGPGTARLVIRERYIDFVTAMFIGYLGDEPLEPLPREVPIRITGYYRLDAKLARGASLAACIAHE